MLRVMVVFGGRSGEHEVSLASARAIIDTLEKSGGYEVYPVGITKEGRWLSSGDPMRELESRSADGGSGLPATVSDKLPANLGRADIVFPVLHGPYGEDGTIQGMLELAGVPYVGSGVLASAAGMDKVTMKKIFAYHGLPQVEWLGLTREDWDENRKRVVQEIEDSLSYPCFVKPSNLGSSVGINKARTPEELEEAVNIAAELDRRIIVEAAAVAREIEVAVLGNEEPKVSVPGEILVGSHEFYNYEAKYTEGESEVLAPADIPESAADEIREIARAAFKAIDAAGMARVDFFLERGTGRVLLNEINTIPGFTPTSVYARLWTASGLPYDQLLDRLIELALERHGTS
ncbi:MAG: D-alanine--D-alanine ligase [Actinomycetota bacterium]|nr:D-alanine--D-alanine ligase [Actinomycetota bacterium]HZY64765.1 D-alanine--D-alanine ligase family protein [Rubrobacteraceae bacterium]